MYFFFLPFILVGVAVAQKNFIDGGFIVQLRPAANHTSRSDAHVGFLEALDKRVGGQFRTRAKYDHKLFTGLAIQLMNAEQLVDLAALPNVAKVYQLGVYSLPKYLHQVDSLLQYSPSVRPVQQRVLKANGDSPFLGESVHTMTGVDAVHASGIKGQGIQIAIVDSGVDYLHDALGGGFGPGFKIAGGYDFVGDDYDGYNDPTPDEDPMDCFGHGTHVTGIIGANGDNVYQMSGVAPEASVYMYKIGGCNGAIADDVIIPAILRAVDDGADVISMSFGGPNSWTNSPLAVLASSVVEQGVVVTISNGNEGRSGIMYSWSPASGEKVISVGAVENTAVITQTFTTSVPHNPMTYVSVTRPNVAGAPVPGVPDTPLPVYAVQPFQDGTPSRDCQELPPSVPENLTGLAVVFSNSDNVECSKWSLIATRNPAVIIQWRHPEVTGSASVPTITISDEDGAWLTEHAGTGNLTVSFPGPPIDSSTGDAGGLMCNFSSMGPTVSPDNRLGFSPSISAPGGDIMSTWLTKDGGWAIQSGTSMAAPYTAGSAALLLQAKGKNAAGDIRGLLQATSQSLPSSRSDGALLQTLAFQGAGLINVAGAISAKTTVSPTELSLNDLANWEGSHTISLKNIGTEPQMYTLAHVAAGTTVTTSEENNEFKPYPVPLVSSPIGVSFSQDTVTIEAGQIATFMVTFTPPPDAKQKTLPVVSGWLTATSSSGEVVKVSYIGVAASLVDAQTISTSKFLDPNNLLPNIMPVDESVAQTGPRNYTLTSPLSTWPIYHFGLSTPSAHVYVEIIDANTDVNSNVPHGDTSAKVKRLNWSNWLPPPTGARLPVPTVPTVGPVAEFMFLPRGGFLHYYWQLDLINFANGTAIPVGQYKVLLRTLRLFGDESNPDHWDVHVSVQFGYVPA
ncbi:subtilisin-like protein [Auriculariales sp. MPI-PUGE-AT-0066]|nr:subtilisin-like protein [Auriculariales sp. MPI-PUGE-AT-0066]